MHRSWTRRQGAAGLTAAALLLSLSVIGQPAAQAVPGDGAAASFSPASGNTLDVSIKNTGSTSQLFDYVQAPAGNGVTSCKVLSGFPAGSSCHVNGAGAGTAEVQIGSGGLTAGQTGVFQFVTTNPLCASSCPTLTGAINSTGNPNDYVDIRIPPAPPCPQIYISGVFSKQPDGIVGVNYSDTAYYEDGKAPYTVTISKGSLPPGLQLTSAPSGNNRGTFTFSGTPTTPGTYTFTVTVTDSTPSPPGPCSASHPVSITIHCGGITINGFGAPNALGDVGRAIKASPLTASGGQPPYTWQVADGRPPGLSLDPDSGSGSATFTGTPTYEAGFEPTVRVIDAKGCWAQRAVEVYIAPRLSEQLSKVGAGTFLQTVLDGSAPGGNIVRRGSTAAERVSKTPVANDLRYRQRKIGGHYGSYVTAFKNKRVTSYKLGVKKGMQYCFSAEPHAAKGKGWGTEACKKVKR